MKNVHLKRGANENMERPMIIQKIIVLGETQKISVFLSPFVSTHKCHFTLYVTR